MKRCLEICVDSYESAVIAFESGADRLELCSGLSEGGVTPSAAFIRAVRRLNGIELMVMIRPRGGDFLYTPDELDIIHNDIQIAKDEGADGIVVGALKPDGCVDKGALAKMIELASPLPVTFHRAFDLAMDPFGALEDIIDCGAKRILTSGQANHVHDNLKLVRELIEHADNRIIIMAGAGINEENIAELFDQTGVYEVHLTGRKTISSMMQIQKENIFLGSNSSISPNCRLIANDETIRKIRYIIDNYN